MCMKKRLFHHCVRAAAAFLILAAFLFAGQKLLIHFQSTPDTPQAQRRLLTVWLRTGNIPAADWLREQAAVFQKKNNGVRIWIRTASQADLALLETNDQEAAPDLIFFAAGESISPSCFSPLASAPYLGKHLKSGLYKNALLAARTQ